VLLKPGQRLTKIYQIGFEVGVSCSKNTQIFQDAMQLLLVGCFVEVADKKGLFKLLFNFFGQNF